MIAQIKPGFSRNGHPYDALHPITLPPDKSIFHRLLFIGALTRSKIRIPISSIEEIPVDVYATILALQSLGVPIDISRSEIEMQGVGINGLHEPKFQIQCANSGTTARLLMGILAGQSFSSKLRGDDSLSKRPMKRLADILDTELGADIVTSNGSLPAVINGKKLHGGAITLPVASAQMKSALLLAGICAGVEVEVTEPYQSRDHTEQMLEAFGAGSVHHNGNTSLVSSSYHFTTGEEFTYRIPGDFSSAAFLIAAAILCKKNIVLSNIGLNPTRKKFLDVLVRSGVLIEISHIKDEWNEKRGTVEIFGAESAATNPFIIQRDEVPLIIDEIPVLSVLAAFCKGETIIAGAAELKNKETDRLLAIVENLKAFGLHADGSDNGIIIYGEEDFVPIATSIEHYGDHRIAMAFTIMALRAKETVTISDGSVVSISYPNFFQDLALIAGSSRILIS